jgi:hypothetical protein
MIAGNDLPRSTSTTVVEKDEVLDHAEEALLVQHPVKKRFGIHTSFVFLTVALPFDKVLPLARNRAVAGLVPIAHHEKGVVMEGMRNNVGVQIPGKVVVKSGPDVLVDRLEFDEHQGQAIDEADQICAGVVVRNAQTLKFQLADCEESVMELTVRSPSIAEIDYSGIGMASFCRFIPPLDGYAATNEGVELSIVLQERLGKVRVCQLLDGLLTSREREVRIESNQGRSEVSDQDCLAFRLASQSPLRSKGFRVVGINAFPAEMIVQMVGKSFLYQAVFTVYVGYHAHIPCISRYSCI